ncbi:MAG: cytochrome c oxidase subunit II [Candidatus Hydrogenedens sp.]|nr:cytochrome c oxidase subunit II [Candidatus Hydrogenedens sp.]
MFNIPLIPEHASTFAAKVDPLFWFLTIFVAIFCVAITAIFIYLGLRYKQTPGRKSEHYENMALELTWSVIPAIIAIGIFWWGTVIYFEYANMPEDTYDVSVVGKQWMWKVQHPNGKTEVNHLTMPVGQAVKLTMTSQDVLHDFYIPAFRVKQDVIPARYTTMWFEATKTGEFPLFCAEYCGTEHSTMVGGVTVLPQAEFTAWLGGETGMTPVEAGAALFQQMGCVTCHAQGDASRGPQLNGKFGTEETFTDGSTATIDEEYIRESIMTPGMKIVQGYAPLMPTFASQLSEDDINNLIAYIKSLS